MAIMPMPAIQSDKRLTTPSAGLIACMNFRIVPFLLLPDFAPDMQKPASKEAGFHFCDY
jgi:hypothetical protein